MKKRFSETQIFEILKEAESGVKVADVCRNHGISPGTYFRWKSKYGGMELSDVKKMKALEDENSKLRKIIAQQAFELHVVKEVIEKKF